MENFIQKIRLRRKTVFIALSTGRAVLGEERYSSRMNDYN
ncbi:hypothetical protein SAMN05421820_11439 [Pedobacter steynii]|uniref:Uncharacterized protein n=1 Tax=Pedobacter steynii TaxID=430522 RepID=A0A1H0J0G6_9SPHI|nr:hypothetical protein SAMN05421820_11439 [Pedobacter steynii]